MRDAFAVSGRYARAPFTWRGASGLILTLVASAFVACGDDGSTARDQGASSSPASERDDASPSTDAVSEVDGGAPPAPSGPPFSFQLCPGASELPLASDVPPCDGDLRCGEESHCFAVPSSPLLAAVAPDCSAGKCLPDRIFAAQGRVAFRQCAGAGGPGVCMPHCFALMRSLLSVFFEQGEGGCSAMEICLPCLNPIDQSSTGACEDRCGAGPANL